MSSPIVRIIGSADRNTVVGRRGGHGSRSDRVESPECVHYYCLSARLVECVTSIEEYRSDTEWTPITHCYGSATLILRSTTCKRLNVPSKVEPKTMRLAMKSTTVAGQSW